MNLIPDATRVPPETIEQRLTICRACSHHGQMPLVKMEFCKACGCPLLNKTKFLNSTCPKGKW